MLFLILLVVVFLAIGFGTLILSKSLSTSAATGSSRYVRPKFPGVPNLLRGRVGQRPKDREDDLKKAQELFRSEGNAKQPNEQGDEKGAAAATAGGPGKLGGPYPYPLLAVDASYDIAKEFAVRGGSRFTEYTDGSTPYTITDEIQQQSDTVARSRRYHVKKAMQFAWDNYVKYAFGKDELLPQSGKGADVWGGQGITLVDALDTLWLMDMKDEFWQARDWVRDHLDHSNVQSVSVFETTIRDLGGLLGAYDWSGDKVFLDKATDLGERLLRAFDGSPTGIPYGQVDLRNGRAENVGWTGGSAILAEFGSIQIEFRYLAKRTGRTEFAKKVENVYKVMHGVAPQNGLYPYYYNNNPRTGSQLEAANKRLTFGAMADSFYEYMLKMWLQGGKTEPLYRDMYDQSMDGMHAELLQKSTPSGLTFIADKDNGKLDTKMDHLVCFMGGLLALGAYTDPRGLDSERAQRDLKTGKALTYTCYQMYARMNTGISAEFVQFHAGQDFVIGRGAPHYLLRPEAVESMFILNQLTGDPIYREWGWEIFQAIEKYCKTTYGYGALSNVQDTMGKPRDKMESFFLAETLKYLYLLQDPDTEVDVLRKHVFNTEAHPLRLFPLID